MVSIIYGLININGLNNIYGLININNIYGLININGIIIIDEIILFIYLWDY